MKKILLTILAVLAMGGMAVAQTAPSDINLHRNEDGSWSFIMPGRNLVMSIETFSTNDTVNGHYLAGVPEGWLILALGDTVPVSNDSLRRTTPITEGTPLTIVPPDSLKKRIKSITLVDVVTAPAGVINGKFTVSAGGDQVYFSKGNLKYDGSAWSFFNNQYDYLTTYDGTNRDKFGWSTSTTTYGMNTSASNDVYSGDFVDWGATMGDGWRTLTKDEWTYLFNTRTASTVGSTENARYAKAKVNDVQGVILFPDTYTHPDGVTAPANVNTANVAFTANTYDATAWAKMESAGCVFLPAAGYRSGSSMGGLGTAGRYWSAMPSGTTSAYGVVFNSSIMNPAFNSSRYFGCSVRLVRPAEAAGGETAAFRSLSEATTDDLGMVVCAAGHLHDAKTAVPTGCTAVGILGKVTTTGHGLILALQNASNQNGNTIDGWTSVETYAGTTLKVLPAGALGSLTSYTTLGSTAVSNWAVAQKDDYEAIFINLGSTTGDSDGTTYDGNVNAYITTGVGGTAISGYCWSATAYSDSNTWAFGNSFWGYPDKTQQGCSVRPVLGF